MASPNLAMKHLVILRNRKRFRKNPPASTNLEAQLRYVLKGWPGRDSAALGVVRGVYIEFLAIEAMFFIR